MLRRFAPLAFTLILLALPASAQAHHAVSVTGEKQVGGQKLYVDVWVVTPPGQSHERTADKALSEQGARRAKPPWAGGDGGGAGRKERYFYTGLKWSPPAVIQNYNDENEPLGLAGEQALKNTHSDWSGLPDSNFAISYGADTDRCPSLVDECPGAQTFDGNEDAGWLELGGNTLGVTWYSTSGSPEADVALNTLFTWKDSCGAGEGFDVETVLLHENGHVVGLGHPNRTDSVMYASYQGPRCELYDYDRRSIANLY